MSSRHIRVSSSADSSGRYLSKSRHSRKSGRVISARKLSAMRQARRAASEGLARAASLRRELLAPRSSAPQNGDAMEVDSVPPPPSTSSNVSLPGPAVDRPFIRWPKGSYHWWFSPQRTPRGIYVQRKMIVAPPGGRNYVKNTMYPACVVRIIAGLGIVSAEYWQVKYSHVVKGEQRWFNFIKFKRRVNMSRPAKFYHVVFSLARRSKRLGQYLKRERKYNRTRGTEQFYYQTGWGKSRRYKRR